MDGPSSGFAAQLRAALAGRVPLLREHGLLDAEEEAQDGKSPRFSAAPDAEEQIERAMKERERGLTPLMEVERVQGSQVAHAKLEPGRIYQGRVVAMVSDPEGTEYVVLDTGPTLAAVPAAQQRFHVDQEIRARAMAREVASEGRWTLVWQFDDLEQAQKHDRDRGR
jgi:hypothetical protein